MNKGLALLIGLVILLYLGYRYFELDKNPLFQKSIQTQDLTKAQEIIQAEVSKKITTEVKKYYYAHNNYFVSSSDNICKTIQSDFDTFKKIYDNPVECKASIHTFTARIKSDSTQSYYCLDQTGFYVTAQTDKGYAEGVACK